jgi:hypothetical protein
LKSLTTLAIHGNPIETLPAYRLYIISKLPMLKNLNFSTISKADRATASTWSKTYGGKIQRLSHGKKKVKDENKED